MRERIKVFGSSLDVLDGHDKVELKRAYISALCAGRDLYPNFLDPYDAISSLHPDLFENACQKAGRVPIESWITPKPNCEDLPRVTSETYKIFLEGNGCQTYSDLAGTFLKTILPNPFAMIGVDHSQTGGVIRELSERYGPEEISLVVLDAHLDIFDFDLLYAVQRQVLQQGSVESSLPEVLYNNSFYNCGNFLKYLLEEKTILPDNLFVIGVTDYPTQMSQNDNPEVRRYLDAYKRVIEQGVKVVPKAEVEGPASTILNILQSIKTPYVYISVDMDVGALSSTCGVRFLNTIGMKEDTIYKTLEAIKRSTAQRNARCLGFDVVEIDVHFAGYFVRGILDRTYDIASNIIRILLAAG